MVQKDRKLSAQCRLFLVGTLTRHMTGDGTVSHPREELANEAGVTGRQVGNYIHQSIELGWLTRLATGRRSATAVYQATYPDSRKPSLPPN